MGAPKSGRNLTVGEPNADRNGARPRPLAAAENGWCTVVPTKLPNKVACATAEVMEGRGLAKGNMVQQNAIRTQRRVVAHNALDRVRQAATKDRKAKFTALLHHVTLGRLQGAYAALARRAAAGVDRMTWAAYGEGLEARLVELHALYIEGKRRAKPIFMAARPVSRGGDGERAERRVEFVGPELGASVAPVVRRELQVPFPWPVRQDPENFV